MSESDKFIEHYHELKDKIFSYLMVRLNYDREVCEDLLMDVVLKAYEKFHTFDSNRASFKTWIFTITHNRLLNYWRDNKTTESLDELEESGVYPAIAHIEEKSEQDIENKNIMKVLSCMSDAERDIISLRYFQDLSYAEIADVTGKQEGAIRTQLSRSLNKFSGLYNKLM